MVASGQRRHIASPSSSRKTTDSLAKMSAGSKSADASGTAPELKGKRSMHETSTKVVSDRHKQPNSVREASSRPASRLSVYVSCVRFTDSCLTITAVVKALRKYYASDAPSKNLAD